MGGFTFSRRSVANFLKLVCIGLLTSGASHGWANGSTNHEVKTWLSKEVPLATHLLLENTSPSDAAPGAIIASTSRNSPPYYYHWVRDSALTVNAMVTLYLHQSGKERADLLQKIEDYVRFSRKGQLADSTTGIGEPKFNVDGSPFLGEWNRPQNDGPALRAVALTRFARILLRHHQRSYVTTELYDGRAKTNTLVKADLDYVAKHWQEPCFDLWEETAGNHFYTRMAERRAMLDGAVLAASLGDHRSAAIYRQTARQLENALKDHWDEKRGLILANLHRTDGPDNKVSGIDSSVFLALLHGDRSDGFVRYASKKVLRVFKNHITAFQTLYPINRDPQAPGVAIGRYPEDRYDGGANVGGNPWVLLTAAFARVAYRAAGEFADRGHGSQARRYFRLGDQFILRLKFHAQNPQSREGAFAEQIDRSSGKMVSAENLTWNYVEILEAAWSRETALRAISQL